MTRRFHERANQREVRFGDKWQPGVVEALEGFERVAIITSPRRAEVGDALELALGDRTTTVVALARQHVPQEVVAEANKEIERIDADAIVTYGGGSAVGLGKALKLASDGALHLVVVPTTFAGSEMTDIYGTRRGTEKEVGRDPKCRPDWVIYDPSLLADLPRAVAVPSLFNAMAHAVDALYAEDPSPQLAELVCDALDALRRAASSMDSESPPWSDALFGAYRAATILGQAGMALHHKLAHVVAGSQDLSHAMTHTALLPHVIAFNWGARSAADEVLKKALATDDPAALVFSLAESAGAEMRLSTAGLSRDALADCADAVAAATFDNPREVSAEVMVSLLDDVRLGRMPAVGRRLGTPQPGGAPHAGIRPLELGCAPEDASMALVIVPGRGSTAERTAGLFGPCFAELVDAATIVVVQPDDRSWYPNGFAEPIADNQPGLDSGLACLHGVVERLLARGLTRERIAILGFSQGACLALDYVARDGAGIGAVCAIAGGLVGDDVPATRHDADLAGVIAVTGVAADDTWVPLLAVKRTRAHYQGQGAEVIAVDHSGSKHTITSEQTEAIRDALKRVKDR